MRLTICEAIVSSIWPLILSEWIVHWKEVDKVFLRNQNTKSTIIHIVNTQIIANNTSKKNHDISSKEETEWWGKGESYQQLRFAI